MFDRDVNKRQTAIRVTCGGNFFVGTNHFLSKMPLKHRERNDDTNDGCKRREPGEGGKTMDAKDANREKGEKHFFHCNLTST